MNRLYDNLSTARYSGENAADMVTDAVNKFIKSFIAHFNKEGYSSDSNESDEPDPEKDLTQFFPYDFPLSLDNPCAYMLQRA